jgi:molybdopterin molybdotransferase
MSYPSDIVLSVRAVRTIGVRGGIMKHFFKVVDIDTVCALRAQFPVVDAETVPLASAAGRILAETVAADLNIPGFARSTMDGYALQASATFGASESNPGYLSVVGSVAMGEQPDIRIGPGEAVRIATGGMLPPGADAVVMIEHTEALDATTIEVYKSVAPGQHVVAQGEDIALGDKLLVRGQPVRPQEAGLLAALGCRTVRVFRKPRIGIVSTGDEVVPVDALPGPGQIRDVNSTTLAAMTLAAGGQPRAYGIIKDNAVLLKTTCARALAENDMILVSGGSSVGMRDFTIEAFEAQPASDIMVHGVSISPGKPTILARSGDKPMWGIPGHVTSAMVVFRILVEPFIAHLGGLGDGLRRTFTIPARLARNLSSAQGRVDFVRVRLANRDGMLLAEPLLGKSGLINTMVRADGLVRIAVDAEGLDKGDIVAVELI